MNRSTCGSESQQVDKPILNWTKKIIEFVIQYAKAVCQETFGEVLICSSPAMYAILLGVTLCVALWFLQGQRSAIRRHGQRLP